MGLGLGFRRVGGNPDSTRIIMAYGPMVSLNYYYKDKSGASFQADTGDLWGHIGFTV